MNHRRKVAFLLLISFVMATIALTIPVRAATTYYVSTTGNNGNTGGSGDPWLTIQHAVDTVISGDTIIVNSGTYAESVVVDTDNIIIQSNTRYGAVVDPPAAGDCFTVDADEVIINGFELTGTTNGYGIGFSGSSNTFVYNKIHNINCGGTGGGICVWDYAPAGPSSHNMIGNNEIYDVTADGILTGCCRPDAVMDGNIITGNKIYNFATLDGWNPAIEEVNGENYVISNNEITGSYHSGLGSYQYYGILHIAWNGIPQGGNTISGNTVTTIRTAICMMAETGETDGLGGVQEGFTSPAEAAVMDSVIENNNLYGNTHGVILYAIAGSTTTAHISGIQVLNNNIHDNSQNGIYLRTLYANGEITDNIFKCNYLTGNNDGAKIVDNNPGDILTNNVFECNNIYGNLLYGIENQAATLISAEKNWWGDSTGPYHASNPGGTGNAVTDNVDFDPWLMSLACHPVGGEWVPVSTIQILVQIVGSIVAMSAIAASFVGFKRIKRKQD